MMGGDAPKISDETLLGYLMGSLSVEESVWIEERLVSSSSLRQRLSDLRSLLEPLAIDDENFEPPAGLVSETMSRVESQEQEIETAKSVQPVQGFQRSGLDWYEAPVGMRMAWIDSLVTLAAGIIFLSILLPFVWHWREESRRMTCEDNLRQVGEAMAFFSTITSNRRIPEIDREGAMSFAGVYAIRLRDFGLLDSIGWLHCPSSPHVDLPQAVPNSRQFLAAHLEEQVSWRSVVGGNYGFHLGNMLNGVYVTPKLDQPFRFALLGDVWPRADGVVGNFDDEMELHGKRGVNVLYNDGSVRWLRVPYSGSNMSLDNPYLNDQSQQGPGIGIADSCLAPSPCSPVVITPIAR
jgi:prepilin-type processing-associated H-X9-DG protein